MSALTALPEDWAIARDGDGYQVVLLSDGCYECGQSYRQIGAGKTVAAAVKAAHATLAREAREEAARTAEHNRRVAEGELKDILGVTSFMPEIWGDEIIKRIGANPTAMRFLNSPVLELEA